MNEPTVEKNGIKTIGKRRLSSGGLVNTDNLFQLMVALRKGKPFHPVGVYRFKTYEEKAAWDRKMMARR
uniref:Uncharacterized protein n=1 Tax=Candidatus Kentrum sp. DK TaxID=2126562 RepID=A0A450S5C3_9GAMM|nr:MAG: hypothetical protein BECKDK2373C_GA0170839_100243 [Candidatus Kentron sp. DK]VFJ47052.1 MAG: hypothetical protein BECKDK2373B_GA0170837_101536 [Candidatus Kentron sp. DK]